MCVVIAYFLGGDVTNFEISLTYLNKPFYLHGKKVNENFKYIENEKSFEDQIKSTFHHF